MLRSFSIKEMLGNADYWTQLAQDKSSWKEFGKYFTEYVEAHVLREDTRASLARDARALVQAQKVVTKD